MEPAPLSRRAVLAAAAGGLAALAGCTAAAPAGSAPTLRPTPAGATVVTPTPGGPGATSSATVSARPAGPTAAPSRTTSPPPDPAKARANELGVVPVMMYHRLTEVPGEYDMTPAAFRRQIRRLLHSGYRPVDARDLASGRIDVAAGRTPVVLTFDDGSPRQFRLLPDGRLDPACSAGILSAECAKVPGAEPRATFYVNRAPFGLTSAQAQTRTLRALLGLGFQLGNHTLDHPDLATLSDRAVAKQFVRLQRLVDSRVPAADLSTMALPFGVDPRDHRLARRGSWDHTAYAFAITLLVGADPAPSPFSRAFDPHNVPRIRGTSWHGDKTPLTGRYWLDHLDDHPRQRYVSAGNPGHVTVPEALRDQVAHRFRDRLITY